MVPSSDEETESDDAGLHPRKACRTVSVAMLLGDIGGILNGKFYVHGLEEVVVVPSFLESSSSPSAGSPLVNHGYGSMFGVASSSPRGSFQREKPSLIDETGTSSHSLSFEAYAPGWAVTRDSLLSEDPTAQDWSRCDHPSAMMSVLVGQSSARMVGDLC
ncbi:unnamed protein product [Lactuca saligna]|uniref:Uncharacterized protein n=1 Tax=Lactuca saligna TaxID=75948 RepID=A0AA35Y846_LACSI|nr:unnamed protein product [Lactuca saligna]